MAEPTTHTYEFKAEIKKLLDIIVHSLYTNRDIFLRELVSNASDALDKVRFESSRGTELKDADQELEIRIDVDKEAGTVTVSDTGIGMSRDEVVANIGTIAHSGTADFLAQAADDASKAGSIIGQFGVGFYAVFMVAAKVRLVSRSWEPQEKPVEWVSDGTGSYEVRLLDEERPRGTSIEVFIKEDAREFADPERITSIIKEHSNFVSFPIYVNGDRVNTIPALWREPKFNVTEEQYGEFYKFLTYDTRAPFDTLHFAVDAPVQFTGLLFIPEQDLNAFTTGYDEYGLDLYVRRVLIQHRNKDLIPQHLGFMRGVVDTEDLPLNISRETIQENVLIRKMAVTITKQVYSRLKKMAAEEPERYAAFWRTHGKTFKLGYGEYDNRETFQELLRFNASSCEDAQGLVSLAEVAGRLKEGQKAIYYVSGPSRESVTMSPHLEIFKRKGIEVLYLYEPIDEFVMETLGSYKDTPVRSVEHADLEEIGKLPDMETEQTPDEELDETQQKSLEGLLGRMKDILGERVVDVRSTGRLSTSPACLVSPDGAPSSQMEKILKVMSKDTTPPQKVLEINPGHALTRNLITTFESDPEDPFLGTAVEEIYDCALLLEGYLTDPHQLVARTFDLLGKASGWYVGGGREKSAEKD